MRVAREVAAGASSKRARCDDHDRGPVLVHALVFFRHGDRTPISRRIADAVSMSREETDFWIAKLPQWNELRVLNSATKLVDEQEQHRPHAQDDDDDKDDKTVLLPRHGGLWPYGQLTAKGITEMREKGRHLRRRYASLLDKACPLTDVYVHSTNIRRTVHSAQSVLHGMFPTHFDDEHNSSNGEDKPETERPLLAIHVDPNDSLAPHHSYDMFGSLEELLAEDLRTHAPPDHEVLAARIRRQLKIADDQRVPWSSLREVFICRREHGRPLPPGFDDALVRAITEFDGWLWHALYGKPAFCFRSFQEGVRRVHSALRDVEQGASKHKLTLFSGHDNSLVALMKALQLDIPRPFIPHYGAMLALEVFRYPQQDELFVKAVFDDKPLPFRGQGNSSMCTFAHFDGLVQQFLTPTRCAI